MSVGMLIMLIGAFTDEVPLAGVITVAAEEVLLLPLLPQRVVWNASTTVVMTP